MKAFRYLLMFILILFNYSCETPTEIPIEKVKISNLDISSTISSARISCNFDYTGNITMVEFLIDKDEDLSSPIHYNATISSGNKLVGNADNLIANTTYYYCFEFSNEVSSMRTDVQSFTTLDYILPTLTKPTISKINGCSANIKSNVTSLGYGNIIESGVLWSTNSNISENDNHISNGSNVNIDINLSGLSINTTYYVRSYAKNEKGIGYSEVNSFMTTNGKPIINTKDITSITSYSAVCGGNVISHEGFSITERGVCWSTSPSPEITSSHTSGGTGLGEFSSSISGLAPGTKYYVKAYAKNINGVSYGEQKIFTTKQ